MVPSESRGVALPFQLGNFSGSAGTTEDGTTGVFTRIGAATQSSYTQGTGITQECGSAVTGGIPLEYLNATSRVHVSGLPAHGNATADGTGQTGSTTGVNATDLSLIHI